MKIRDPLPPRLLAVEVRVRVREDANDTGVRRDRRPTSIWTRRALAASELAAIREALRQENAQTTSRLYTIYPRPRP